MNILHSAYEKEPMDLYFDIFACSLNDGKFDYFENKEEVLRFVHFLLINDYMTVGSIINSEYVKWDLNVDTSVGQISKKFDQVGSWLDLFYTIWFEITPKGLDFIMPYVNFINAFRARLAGFIKTNGTLTLYELYTFVKDEAPEYDSDLLTYVIEEILVVLLDEARMYKWDMTNCEEVSFDIGDILIQEIAERRFVKDEMSHYLIKYDTKRANRSRSIPVGLLQK